MDHGTYDVRDARQRGLAFVGFSLLLSWTIWAGLWAPGVHRVPGAPTAIMLLGLWGPAVATKLTSALFRPRYATEQAPPEDEPARPRDYSLAVVLAAACCLGALGLAVAIGKATWAWTWQPTGYSLVFVGSFNYLPFELYDVVNNIGLAAQTIVAELGCMLFAMALVAGAEIGFRGYLLPTVLRLDFRPWLAAIVVGAAWGVWWLPLAWRGNLTGFYPGEPLLGSAMLVASSTAWGSLLGWLFLRSRRIGPSMLAATFAAWSAWSLPQLSTGYNLLFFAEARSLSCASIVAVLSALLWWLAAPARERCRAEQEKREGP